MTCTTDYGLTYSLAQTAQHFTNSNEQRALQEFKHVSNISKDAEHGVYYEVWNAMGRPCHHADYGRAAFHNLDGQIIPTHKKVEAIVRYIGATREFNRSASEGFRSQMGKLQLMGSVECPANLLDILVKSAIEWSRKKGWVISVKGKCTII